MAERGFQSVGSLLRKMESADKDYRFMAVSDFMVWMSSDTTQLDDHTEKKAMRALLKLLEDPNGEVQNVAVKCVGLLVTKVNEQCLETILSSLCAKCLSDNESTRGVSSMGLRAVLLQLPFPSKRVTKNVCEYLTCQLIKGLEQEDILVQLDALEPLSELFGRFGQLMSPQHVLSTLTALAPKLSSPRQVVRKRVIALYSVLMQLCDNATYEDSINFVYDNLTVRYDRTTCDTHLQCASAICRRTPQRFRAHAGRFLPLILQYCAEQHDDACEHCLQALQSFIQECPDQVAPHLKEVVTVCLDHVTYDPNYNYEDDNADECAEPEESDNDSDMYSDDEDTTWKVRRAAAKCLKLLVDNYLKLLDEFHGSLGATLLRQLKERDENVRSEIFAALTAFLKQSYNHGLLSQAAGELLPELIKRICLQLRNKSAKTRQGCFSLLAVQLEVAPSALSPYITELVSSSQFSLDRSRLNDNHMCLAAFGFISSLLRLHPLEAFHPCLGDLLPAVAKCAESDYNKVAVAALQMLQQLTRAMRPLDGVANFNYAPFVNGIYNCVLERLKSPKVEVNEQAIATMGTIVRHFGDVLHEELSTPLLLFAARLRGENTRLSAVQALMEVATSPLHIDLLNINDVILSLKLFLRHNRRLLKFHTLQLLDCLIRNYYNHVDVEQLSGIAGELQDLLDDSDVQMTQRTLVLLQTLTYYHTPVVYQNMWGILNRIFELIKSPLIQGVTMTPLQQFLKTLVQCGLPDLTYADLLNALIHPYLYHAEGDASKSKRYLYRLLSKCVGAITAACPENLQPVLLEFKQRVAYFKSGFECAFSLYIIGEIGRETNVMDTEGLKDVIWHSFGDEDEDVRVAATAAYGNIVLGNLSENLPVLLCEIGSCPDRLYFLLASLREIVKESLRPESAHVASELAPFVPQIWRQLIQCPLSDEVVHDVLAQCIGKMVALDPHYLLPELTKFVRHLSPQLRALAVNALKYTVSQQTHNIDYLLKTDIKEFLKAVQDEEVAVRRSALYLFSCVINNKKFLVEDALDLILPYLYKETSVNKSLIRRVELGPFTHVDDEGLDMRKLAYECMYALLQHCLDKIDVPEFLAHVKTGLEDHNDIKILAHVMVERLAKLCPSAVFEELDSIASLVYNNCSNTVDQVYQRQNEVDKSALRAILALTKVPEAYKTMNLTQIVAHVKNVPHLKDIFASFTFEDKTVDEECMEDD